jgi:CPA2 family monovalent cation:H+ antiporter-2
MHHATPLISTIVGGIVLAFILGAIASRLRLPPLIGYLCAGIVVGPHTPGYTADQALAPELAELGVILLMFGVGLHFSIKDLMAVKRIAIPGAVVQIGIATLMGMLVAWGFGWSWGQGLVYGLALSVASTVVLLKALQERDLVESPQGRIAVGWLIVEDLAMVLALVLLPAMAGLLAGAGETSGEAAPATGEVVFAIFATLGKVAAFVAVMLVIGRRFIPWMLERIVWTGNREMFRLGVLATALGVAYGAYALFGVSFALGAFFAGMVLAESEFSHRAAEESLPLRDAFAVLFFVSVGMLFDPMVLVNDPWGVLGTVFIIVVGKSLAALAIVRAFGHSGQTGMTIAVSLAQIGEFSFILASLGVYLKILPERGQALILAGALLSIMLNPVLFHLLDLYTARRNRSADPPIRGAMVRRYSVKASSPWVGNLSWCTTSCSGRTMRGRPSRIATSVPRSSSSRTTCSDRQLTPKPLITARLMASALPSSSAKRSSPSSGISRSSMTSRVPEPGSRTIHSASRSATRSCGTAASGCEGPTTTTISSSHQRTLRRSRSWLAPSTRPISASNCSNDCSTSRVLPMRRSSVHGPLREWRKPASSGGRM